MRNILLSTAASAAAFVALAAPASAATVITLTPGPGGVRTGAVDMVVSGGTPESPFSFTETFTFELPSMGLTSVALSTSATTATNNIDFTSVLLNGTALTLIPGANEFATISNFPTMAGTQTLVVNGLSRGVGSFGGSITFSPTAAVPEPTTWALLLLGFAAVGFSMRRNKVSAQEARVRYSFA
ncbi:PEP-CTERM sorting domain-containing protein [Erythrobacteraceae bacterium CFH 75059]|uniref:FxDxF family PEP-CTERM protein n=1 Tax=Qipengyuania thermophila TaxID=2509361 RepID=UPI00101F49D0|nr:FxDxF family PEP-CTERM protein [Qipengyuania thermophila]TCD04863.1 PEP-CTERM sorting domain-containing protein [Erythrobacteraceae bacterium CFH 75059]